MKRDTTVNLCLSCLHARRVESARGSQFIMCERSKTDPHYPKYPRMPVTTCAGYDERARDDCSQPPTSNT